MSLPDPSVLADSLGLVAGSGPFVEPIWAEIDHDAAIDVVVKAQAVSLEEKDSFYAHFNALYLPSLVFAMNSLPLDDSEEVLRSVMVIFSTLQGCMVPKTSHYPPTFARFVRLETTQTLRLYTSLLGLIAFVLNLEVWTRAPDLLFTFEALVFSIHIYLPSAVTLPAIEPSLLEKLGAVVASLDKTRRSTPEPKKARYERLYAIIEPIFNHGVLDLRAIMAKQVDDTTASPWWTCELKRAGDEEIESCAQLEEGEEMRACSRCLAVRYCSREHQRLDWRRHRVVCFKPSW
ncbi:hypothetical protein BDY24DRAFT_438058 [Mrakia frigida]|uniref:zinc finger MYND domain-containing protein n=1 Tax=Mrakia frigida TaxID=29902 RepID=UPI003FCBF5F0